MHHQQQTCPKSSSKFTNVHFCVNICKRSPVVNNIILVKSNLLQKGETTAV